MSAEDPRLLGIAERISDGHAVDWAREGTALQGELRAVAMGLGFVETVAQAFQSVGSTELAVTETQTVTDGWGPLELRATIGAGGFGHVYRAWDPKLEREVALKLLPGSSDAVIEEARMLARVRHPNVVAVHGADRHDGRVGLWMELLRGRTLADALREQGPFGAREAALIGIDLCHALAAIHAAGLVHRDVKAGNVMREAGGRIVLMDLGAGVRRPDGAGSSTPEPVSGTPPYMSPEVLAGEPATARSDCYSLGVLLFHLVSGKYPVEADSIEGLRQRHQRGERRLLRDVRPDLPEAFVRAVETALAPQPQQRYSSAGEMERALANALGPIAEREGFAPRPPAWTRSLSWLAAGVVVAAATFVALRMAGVTGGRGAYEVEAAFRRETAEGSERLLPGGLVAPGDKLFLEFRASRPVHLYVIDQDERGASYLLFPSPDLVAQNPLVAGVTYRLPGRLRGREKAFTWLVSSAGGREHFVLVASPERLTGFEREALALARPSTEPIIAAQLGSDALTQLRGVGGLAEAASQGDGPGASPLFELAAQLAAGMEGARGVWVRQFDLENPAANEGDPP